MKIIICQNKKILTYILISLIIISFSQCKVPVQKKGSDTIANKSGINFRAHKIVSLIGLIANPEKYDGKHVTVIGFLSLAFEGNVLFLHKEDYDSNLVNNGIWIEISDPEHYQNNNKKYVIIDGVFDVNNTGHMSAFTGAIKKITRVKNLEHPIVVNP